MSLPHCEWVGLQCFIVAFHDHTQLHSWLEQICCAVVDPEGVQGVHSNSSPRPTFKISYKNEKKIDSVRPNYFSFMGYLGL